MRPPGRFQAVAATIAQHNTRLSRTEAPPTLSRLLGTAFAAVHRSLPVVLARHFVLATRGRRLWLHGHAHAPSRRVIVATGTHVRRLPASAPAACDACGANVGALARRRCVLVAAGIRVSAHGGLRARATLAGMPGLPSFPEVRLPGVVRRVAGHLHARYQHLAKRRTQKRLLPSSSHCVGAPLQFQPCRTQAAAAAERCSTARSTGHACSRVDRRARPTPRSQGL